MEVYISITLFLHLDEIKNDDFDLEKFNIEMERRYTETTNIISNNKLFSYDICWKNYSEHYQFTLMMARKRTTFP